MSLIDTVPPSVNSPAYFSNLISAANHRIRSHVTPTRLIHDEEMGLWLKCENEQNTGSFKWRGALSKLSTLTPGEEIITASTGNHGLGVSTAASLFGLKAKIFVPKNAVRQKINKIRNTGADVIEVDGDSLSAEIAGKTFAQDHHLTWVSPYNDELVIAGQGTIGLELSETLTAIDRIYITVGGGGLISGIASWLRQHQPEIDIVGCQPINSPEMYLSILSGQVVMAPDSLDTLSDGSAGPLEEDSITYPICCALVDRFILITEDEIRDAIKQLYEKYGLKVEGAAGVAMAAAMKDEQRKKEDVSVVVLCGGNIDPIIWERVRT
ncbi:MAG: pyridoxal-phosphate dependent enzyme [Bacteroidota bacterium]|nr:pyridoxal-phosphate dependent enzyme [Bacteroidota bacterium]